MPVLGCSVEHGACVIMCYLSMGREGEGGGGLQVLPAEEGDDGDQDDEDRTDRIRVLGDVDVQAVL